MNSDMISKAANLCNIGSGWPSPWFRSSGRFCSLVYEPLSYLHKQSALYWSAEFGLVDVTKFLLDKGTNPNIRGCHFGNVLQAVAYGGYEVIVRDLLDAGETTNAQGGRHNSALEAACCKGYIAVIDILL